MKSGGLPGLGGAGPERFEGGGGTREEAAGEEIRDRDSMRSRRNSSRRKIQTGPLLPRVKIHPSGNLANCP